MKKSSQNILLLFCGGTIYVGEDEKLETPTASKTAQQYFLTEPRLNEVADITVETITDIHSCNMTPRTWEHMITAIKANYDQYDGFVIAMGTDTLAYASSALAFALQDIGKPVVLTGAQIAFKAINTDGRNNLINALMLASSNVAGVLVAFGSKIIRGCRAQKVSESMLDAFKTFNAPDFGEISLGIKINAVDHKRHSRKPKIVNGFDPNVISISCTPGLDSRYLDALLDQGMKGLIIRGFGAGNIPNTLIPSLEKARDVNVPVVITTQGPYALSVIGMHDVSPRAGEAGAIQAYDMTMAAATTKLMWLLKQKLSYDEVKKKMHENMVGEINVQKSELYVNDFVDDLSNYQNFA